MPEAEKAVALIHQPKKRGMPGVFRFRANNKVSLYLFREISCDVGGRGWEVWRLTAQQPYHVRTGYVGSNLFCDCNGFTSFGMCRHVLAIQNFVHLGLVGDGAEAVDEEPPNVSEIVWNEVREETSEPFEGI